MSLAASVFGMNVREVNATGHGIWIFLVCAFVSLALAFLAWALCKLFMRARTNRRLLRLYWGQRRKDQRYDESDPSVDQLRWRETFQKQKGLWYGEKDHNWRRLWAYHLGFLSVNDLGIKESDLNTDNMW